jgi:hypothetical protein
MRRDDNILSKEEIECLIQSWENDHFLPLNNWCQYTRCRLDTQSSEIEFQKYFKTDVRILDDFNILSCDISSTGYGKNKKDSKFNAMKGIMTRLIDTGNIHLGLKTKTAKPKLTYEQKQKEENKQVDLDGNNLTRLYRQMIKKLISKEDNEALDALKKIMSIKNKADWVEISHYWEYLLRNRYLYKLNSFLDFLSSPNNEISLENINTDNKENCNQFLLNEFTERGNYKLGITIIEELYYSLIFTCDYSIIILK